LWVGLGAATTFAIAAITSALAAVIAWRLVPGDSRPFGMKG
jgi:hypothetical protein